MTAPFDWSAHNARLDAALAEWDATERALAQLHINMAAEVRALIEGITT